MHADVAARLIDNFVRRREHYDSVIGAMRERGIAAPEDRKLAGLLNAMASQLLATRDDLLRLMEDAKQQGTENLRRMGRSAGPNPDTSLTAPDSANPDEVAATVYVMWDGLKHAARDAADQIDRLVGWLSRVNDPEAATFTEQLRRMAGQLRPPGMPPGPYAPRPGVDVV